MDAVAAASLIIRGVVILKNDPVLDTLAFSTEVHAIYMRFAFVTSRSRPPQTYDGFETFVVDAVKRMDSLTLDGPSSKGADGRVLKRHYQAEFYRRVAVFAIVPYSSCLLLS